MANRGCYRGIPGTLNYPKRGASARTKPEQTYQRVDGAGEGQVLGMQHPAAPISSEWPVRVEDGRLHLGCPGPPRH